MNPRKVLQGEERKKHTYAKKQKSNASAAGGKKKQNNFNCKSPSEFMLDSIASDFILATAKVHFEAEMLQSIIQGIRDGRGRCGIVKKEPIFLYKKTLKCVKHTEEKPL